MSVVCSEGDQCLCLNSPDFLLSVARSEEHSVSVIVGLITALIGLDPSFSCHGMLVCGMKKDSNLLAVCPGSVFHALGNRDQRETCRY